MKETTRTFAITERDMIENDLNEMTIKKHVERMITEIESAVRCVLDYQISEQMLVIQVSVKAFIPDTANEDIVMTVINRQMHEMECELRG